VTTVDRNVTVVEGGKTLVKRVPVVRRVLVHPQTKVETRTVKGRIVTVAVAGKAVTVAGRIVTVAGERQIQSKTIFVPTVKTRTITNSETVPSVSSSTVVVTVPVTTTLRETSTVVAAQPPPAQTVTAIRTVTDPVTVTQAAVTVTVPIVTVTVPLTVTAR
jgi:hypothetical protein